MRGPIVRSAFLGATFVALIASRLPCQTSTAAPASVPGPMRGYFALNRDNRSGLERALNVVGLSTAKVGRSFVLIMGVSDYPNMPAAYQRLDAAAQDIEMLTKYFRDEEFADEIVVLKNGAFSYGTVQYFLQTYFPERLRQFPMSRLLIAFSGHGYVEGGEGYLLQSTARTLDDVGQSLSLSVLRDLVQRDVRADQRVLVLINSCYSGAFTRRAFGGVAAVPTEPGAHAIVASRSTELAWADPKAGPGSLFFGSLLRGLNGGADIYPAPAGDGVIPVDELFTFLNNEVQSLTNGKQKPDWGDLFPQGSPGGYFFLNRSRQVARGTVPAWIPGRLVGFGADGEKAVARLAEAESLYAAKKYVDAIPLLESLAPTSARAASLVAYMYDQGLGVTQDRSRSALLYRQAADAGVAWSMGNLGILYEAGTGVPRDYVQAALWYRKAADAGSANGMAYLGDLYERGRGVPLDSAQAIQWYRKGADAGSSYGMNKLGLAYEHGMGVQQSYGQALEWYRKAADVGNDQGMSNLGILYEAGTGVAQDYAQAALWYRKAADAGSANGMAYLGDLYERGRGAPLDSAQAIQWYRKGADAGSSYGMNKLGLAYEHGMSVRQSYGQAFEWYRKAADAGNDGGMTNLGRLYEAGTGVPQDYTQAALWYRKAADAGNANGMAYLAESYERGRGVPKDLSEAMRLYREAASKGSEYAKAALRRLNPGVEEFIPSAAAGIALRDDGPRKYFTIARQ